MNADTSPEAVERLAWRVHESRAARELRAEASATLRTLSAENAALRARLATARELRVDASATLRAMCGDNAALRSQLATAREDALREAADEVYLECWTDGSGGPASETLLAEQATTSIAVRAILSLIPAPNSTEGD